MLKAKKSLGQHFLRSDKAIKQIVDSIEAPQQVRDKNDFVIFEIGPGEGVLTREILAKGYTVFAIEIDKDAIFYLKENFKEEIKNRKLFIIEHDCLEVDYGNFLKDHKFKSYYLVGNIPYYITGAIFRHTFEQNVLPTGATFLIQKEVAQRIVANDNKESILSISIKMFSEHVKIVDIVKAGSFSPPPKVDSAILKIGNIKNNFKNKKQYQDFFDILRSAFHHKRKFALSNIKNELGEEKKIFMSKFILEKERAEDISTLTWFQVLKNL